MPAEWAPHAATWLSWPADEETWPGKVEAAGQAMARWVREIVRDRPGAFPERAEVLVQDQSHAQAVAKVLSDWVVDPERVGLRVCPNNGSWVRDFGPTFVTRAADPGDGLGTVAAVRWSFDAWGGHGDDYYGERAPLDGEVAPWIAGHAGSTLFEAGVVLEGGAIDTDGAGSLLTTTRCLVARDDRGQETQTARRDRVERVLADFLGTPNVLWLDGVEFEGDDTGGHVDNLARFVAPGRVAVAVESDRSDPLYEPLKKAAKALAAMRDASGRPLDVVEIPLPAPLHLRSIRERHPAVWRYPASYLNFYIANGCVLVPTYADAADRVALERIQAAVGDRPVIGMDCCEFILGQGAIHCSTQQQPEPPAPE